MQNSTQGQFNIFVEAPTYLCLIWFIKPLNTAFKVQTCKYSSLSLLDCFLQANFYDRFNLQRSDPYSMWLCPVRNWYEPKLVLTWAFWMRTCFVDVCSFTAQSFSSFFAWWTLPIPSKLPCHWQTMLICWDIDVKGTDVVSFRAFFFMLSHF